MLKNTVKDWRQKNKISKAHLARQIGVCRSYVSKLEQHALQPSGEIMFRVAEYFKLRIEDVFQRGTGAASRGHFFGSNPLPNGNTVSKAGRRAEAAGPGKEFPCGVLPVVRKQQKRQQKEEIK